MSPMSITEKFNEDYSSFCYEVQHIAATGLLGGHVYKNILDKNCLLLMALTILNIATVCVTTTVISPLYTIILSASSLGLLGFTIYKIYERYSYRLNARILEPIFIQALKGNFIKAHEELNDRLNSIFSIKDNNKRMQKFTIFSNSAPFLNPRTGSSLGGDSDMQRFYWNLSTLNAVEKTRDADLQTFSKYYDEVRKMSDWVGVRCHHRADTLLSNAKKTLKKNPPPQVEMDEILWDDLKENLKYNPREYEEFKKFGPFVHSLPHLLDFVKYMSQLFPQNPNSRRYQNCLTLEQFYEA
ncbi:MAG: hypothetical protein H0W50_05550 [Parachlamydiaceae bacterium]|nr:hypothetical protein [Parachlamydiaceae bacterium]